MPDLYPIARSDVPLELKPHVDALVWNLLAIGAAPKWFRAALELYRLADAKLWADHAQQVRDPHKLAVRWICMACLDGAMQVYHGRKALDGISQTLRDLPKLKEAVDHQALRGVRRQFDTDFPNWEVLRHAVSHSSELGMTAAAFAANAAIQHVDSTTGIGERSVGMRTSGSTLLMSIGGQNYSYDLSEENLQKLIAYRVEIRRILAAPNLYFSMKKVT